MCSAYNYSTQALLSKVHSWNTSGLPNWQQFKGHSQESAECMEVFGAVPQKFFISSGKTYLLVVVRMRSI